MGWFRGMAALFLAPPAPLVDIVRGWRFRGRGVICVDLAALQAEGEEGLDLLSSVLERAQRDPQVRGVRLRLSGTRGGFARVQEARELLRRFVASGRSAVVELSMAGNLDLYLASVASRVFMVPSGEVMAGGVALRMTFFGDLLKRLGVVFDVISAGPYKSLGETWTREGPSRFHREAMAAIVEDLQDQWVTGVAHGRSLEPGSVADALEAVPLGAQEALDRGLVDELAWPDEVEGKLPGILGFEPVLVPLRSYLHWDWVRGLHRRLAGWSRNVAVVHLGGTVVVHPPNGGASWIASDEVIPVLEALRESQDVGAVVLAVDSGGGSALASDLIWRAVARLGETRPVVALLRNVAASGGYYLAVPASQILAQPGTLVGSIGVVAGKLVLGPALQRLGVHGTTLKGAGSADLADSDDAFSAPERRRMSLSVERTYQRFLERVADGRRCPVQAVVPHAGGRVWTGREGRSRALLDGFGTLGDAWRRACVLAGYPPSPEATGTLHIHVGRRRSLPRMVRGLLGLTLRDLSPLSGLDRAVGLQDLTRLAVLLSSPTPEPLTVLPWVGCGDAFHE